MDETTSRARKRGNASPTHARAYTLIDHFNPDYVQFLTSASISNPSMIHPARSRRAGLTLTGNHEIRLSTTSRP